VRQHDLFVGVLVPQLDVPFLRIRRLVLHQVLGGAKERALSVLGAERPGQWELACCSADMHQVWVCKMYKQQVYNTCCTL